MRHTDAQLTITSFAEDQLIEFYDDIMWKQTQSTGEWI